MSTEPYTEDEFLQDCRDWSRATRKQRADAFDLLFTKVGALAVHRQPVFLVEGLREIRANRDKS